MCDERLAKSSQSTLESCVTKALLWVTRRYAGNGFEELCANCPPHGRSTKRAIVRVRPSRVR
jgi:hypothetical protein